MATIDIISVDCSGEIQAIVGLGEGEDYDGVNPVTVTVDDGNPAAMTRHLQTHLWKYQAGDLTTEVSVVANLTYSITEVTYDQEVESDPYTEDCGGSE